MSEMTVLCELKPHLRNYIEAKFGSGIGSGIPVEISQRNYLGKLVRSLLAKTPKQPHFPSKENSLTFALPFFNDLDVRSFNYLSANSQRMIQRGVNDVFFMELHRLILRTSKGGKGPFTQKEAIYHFMEVYELVDLITFDALKRAYYRWLENEVTCEKGKGLVQIFNENSLEFAV